ncbi:MAG: molybdate ABC transporter substrate-binding protein, partial [Coriobacteriales bacterium]|nr:molybdate ABC transporter substrate-binding protein [Coriobacteriales bacterium]
AATEETEVTAEPVELQIFAANSLEKALPEVQALYTAANPEVTFAETQFKGSGDLVTELQGGAPADIFISASKSTMDDAVANGNIDEATRKDMFGNDLVIVAATGSDIQISSLEDVNTDAITKIAIGESASVPAGAYANQSLNTLGLYSSDTGKDGTYDAGFESKLVFQSSVGNVAKTVESGDCQIGFVYSSDVYRYTGIEIIFTVPADTHKAIVYPGAVVADSANAEAAQAFLDFCSTDPEAQAIWSKYGCEVK